MEKRETSRVTPDPRALRNFHYTQEETKMKSRIMLTVGALALMLSVLGPTQSAQAFLGLDSPLGGAATGALIGGIAGGGSGAAIGAGAGALVGAINKQ